MATPSKQPKLTYEPLAEQSKEKEMNDLKNQLEKQNLEEIQNVTAIGVKTKLKRTETRIETWNNRIETQNNRMETGNNQIETRNNRIETWIEKENSK